MKETKDLVDQPGVLPLDARRHAGLRQVRARESSREQGHFVRQHLGVVSELRHIRHHWRAREPGLQHRHRRFPNLTQHGGPVTGAPEPELEASDAREQTGHDMLVDARGLGLLGARHRTPLASGLGNGRSSGPPPPRGTGHHRPPSRFTNGTRS